MTFDVIIVGAGPAGNASALKCAEYGLNTLVIEKRKLPRHKVCSGMIMGPVAHALLQKFGPLPESILSSPSYLSGYVFHVPGFGERKLDNHTSLCWRKDLDYWMSQRAQAKGAEVWDSVKIVGLRYKEQSFSVEIEKNKMRQRLEAGFLIGGDGSTSSVRRFLFPGLKVRYVKVYQECYQGEINLDKNYFHWFYPKEQIPSGFTVHHKDDLVVVDVWGIVRQIRKCMDWVKNFLAENYHFDFSQKPVWRGGCLVPILYRELISHTFLPAKGNALLVGDAAGFLLPVSGEGIGTAIKSGLLAADAIVKAVTTGKTAADTYIKEIKGMISVIKESSEWMKRIIDETKIGGQGLLETIREAYRNTLKTF